MLTLLTLLFFSDTHAMSVDEAIQSALTSSPLILKTQSASQEAKWKTRENWSGYLPTLSASANHLLDKRYALTNINFGGNPAIVPQIIPSTQLSLTATYSVFEGFSSWNKLRSAMEAQNSADKELEWTKLKVEQDSTLAFYKALASRKLQEIAQRNYNVLLDHLKEVQLYKKTGMATNYDVLRVEVQVSNAQTELMNATDNIALSDQSLLEIMGLEKIDLKLDGDFPEFTDSQLKKVENADIKSRSDLEALKLKINSLSYASSAQNSFWLPRISLFGQYQHYNNLNDAWFESSKFRDAYQIGVAVTWNIFDGMVSISRANQTSEQYFQLEKSYRIAELKAQKEFDLWKRKYNYFLNFYKARMSDISKSKESVRLAKEGRRVGARSNTDLLDAESDLYKSEAGAINAQIGAMEALINLELSVGHKI
jgi:outer membrane protein TolC